MQFFKAGKIKPYTIEWLHVERGMSDPFRELFGNRPNSTTQTPNHDIDFVLTHGISVSGISTLEMNNPAQSDHLGICINLNLASFFSSNFSDMTSQAPRNLISGKKKSVDAYLQYVTDQFTDHKIFQRTEELYTLATNDPSKFLDECVSTLKQLDIQITAIMIAGEREGARKSTQRQYWSPEQQNLARTFSYYKQKHQCV